MELFVPGESGLRNYDLVRSSNFGLRLDFSIFAEGEKIFAKFFSLGVEFC